MFQPKILLIMLPFLGVSIQYGANGFVLFYVVTVIAAIIFILKGSKF